MSDRLLFDFTGPAAAAAWQAVDDRVMGGVSESRLDAAEGGGAVFSGTVSRAQGGGFASVRAPVAARRLDGCVAVAVRARGDGQRYRLNLYAEAPPGALRYQAAFQANAAWQTHVLPLAAFAARRRGRSVPAAPPLGPAQAIHAASLMIADAQAGPFRLALQWIKAVPPPR